ncbi:MAG: extracellular solute-binding protein [Meiothermus sp.]|uniref:ABC transporter substrate-binding protein n=1 Tax=Meiothermus sp. TaxID=1955249 RepID=UPI0025EC5E39|nr:extracellular solute-binding protein [Meiothermus sp.]MCS7058277.1 extracellular solute-binding protein [Meiothermus sp.]MCS7193573.1 extracellular solute-binding protein [Meiothermus sp.]MCX7739837.1 extracellular solute-binding protein [Meiothermus sp.]MDW8090586.1 extracellular solute-binding protein [Meiothermus sp.]MDW8480502.1 extracellular solute-binding protein [Meiothermus sp.]
MRNWLLSLVLLLGSLGMAQSGKLEIFSWWAGDEGPALQALIDLYKRRYPNVEVINATVTGGAGVNARAVLKTRMLGGDPPDSFQVHAGQELIGTWVVADRMEDLTPLFRQEGWLDKFPKGLIELISYKGKIYSVPVNIHRSNVMWYIPAKLREWGVQPPKTWAEFLTVCRTLKGKGLEAPLALGENWTQQHLWESVALGVLGAADYANLWTGKLRFTDPKAVAVWNTFGQVLDCANKDAAGLSWQQAVDRMLEGKAAFNIMGDWAAGYMTTTKGLKPGQDFGWAPAPSTAGVFMMLSDSFGLPKGVKNRTNTINWLRLLGSKEGQDTFNPLKGSIAARTDSDPSKYNAYLQSAMRDWRTNRIVGSLVHGAVAPESFMSQFGTVMEIYLSSRNAQAAANAAQAIANQVRLGQ